MRFRRNPPDGCCYLLFVWMCEMPQLMPTRHSPRGSISRTCRSGRPGTTTDATTVARRG
jgi:hypothetical protein